MSQKRKSSTQPLTVQNSDMIFEDEDDDQQANSVAGGSTKGSGGSRISNRAKKVKSIYDPSEFNGPVHKRKKEALEVEKTKVPVKRKLSLLLQHKAATIQEPKPAADVVAKTPESSPKKTPPVKSPVKAKPDSEPRKRLPMNKPVPIQPKPSVIQTLPTVKEPSKRIQARKLVKGQASSDTSAGGGPSKKQRIASASTGFSSDDDFDAASTVENRNGGDIPDVSKWTHHQVSDYFTRLGFNARDAAMFKEEEIDGETLLIMRRSDIVNATKLKLGTTLKMWTEILKFQTGSNDPTQGWK